MFRVVSPCLVDRGSRGENIAPCYVFKYLGAIQGLTLKLTVGPFIFERILFVLHISLLVSWESWARTRTLQEKREWVLRMHENNKLYRCCKDAPCWQHAGTGNRRHRYCLFSILILLCSSAILHQVTMNLGQNPTIGSLMRVYTDRVSCEMSGPTTMRFL